MSLPQGGWKMDTHTHPQETRVALVILILAVFGFVFYFVSGTPVDKRGSMASETEEGPQIRYPNYDTVHEQKILR
jgi:hypothetical protein